MNRRRCRAICFRINNLHLIAWQSYRLPRVRAAYVCTSRVAVSILGVLLIVFYHVFVSIVLELVHFRHDCGFCQYLML
jgi:hypothetical protein